MNEDIINKELHDAMPKMTAYQYMTELNKNNGNKTALTFRNRKIKYDEFNDKIEEYAKGFLSLGINAGDVVGLLLPNVPESTYIAYALNKIGAISDNIDPRVTPSLMEHFIKTEKPKTIVCFDMAYASSIKPIEEKICNEYGIEKIIVMGLEDVLKFPERQIINIKQKFKKMGDKFNSNYLDILKISDILKNSKYTLYYTNPYVENQLATICHSSGTTGLPKMMPATNDNMNFLVLQHKYENVDFKNIKSFLHALPGFAQFGFTNSMHLGHCLGLNMLETPIIDSSSFSSIILKSKPNCVYGLPSWWLALIEDKRNEKIDLSFLYEAVSGGDNLSIEQMEKINKFFIEHNAHCKIRTGYGMSEFCGSCSIVDPEKKITGGLGKLMAGTSYKIIDEKNNVINNGGIGTLCLRKESMPIEHLNGIKIYNSILIDGKKYLVTGDLAYCSNNELFFEGRNNGMFPRYDGYKVIPKNIERAIIKNGNVKDCMVTNYYEESKCGKMPIVHMVLNKKMDENDLKNLINDIIKNDFLNSTHVTTRDIPSKWLIREELPLTPNEKKDYKALTAEGLNGSEITVDIEENNLGISSINILFPSNQNIKTKRI